jgi:hypothetical protein
LRFCCQQLTSVLPVPVNSQLLLLQALLLLRVCLCRPANAATISCRP